MNFNNLSTSDWQSFSYLAIILVVMLSSLFSRGMAFGKIFKYLAIWSAVGLVFVALYSYRFEFADFKTRIAGEINPTSVRVSDSGELEINLAQDGHFYIDVTINNMPVRFMIDTGASDIVMSLKEAKRLGIDLKKLTFNKPYQTANGTSWGASVTLEKVEVGNAVFHDVSASINNADMGTSLLGMSFLRKFKKYEFYRNRLVLTI
ncbi:MAG: TIGR02281 family clan AA aspartic protease [Rickettsiales bacterium]|nr:TIGR02281 family clan AA aspartic protease [Rickettsiales bacterium]